MSTDRESQFAKLRQLGQHRDAKRNEMEDIFQRKHQALTRQTALMEQLQRLQKELMQCNLQLQGVKTEIHQADQEMILVNDTLFELDDQITTLEETLGVQDAEDQTEEKVDLVVVPSHSSTGTSPLVPDIDDDSKPSSLLLDHQALQNRNNHDDDDSRIIIHTTLTQTFGITNFRENQLAIIQSTMEPHSQDVFVIMRTGGGKSLLYQLPVVLEREQHKLTLVISPLLSLMQGTVFSFDLSTTTAPSQYVLVAFPPLPLHVRPSSYVDQKDQMNQFCPNVCEALLSGQTKTEVAHIWQRIRDTNQHVGMLIVTPERIAKSKQLKAELQHLYLAGRLARIVIDECHCCCQWGHDFRPDYAKLGVLRQTFTTVPIMAVTATASDRVREDCARILQLRPNYRFFRSTANRPNLTYSIRRKEGSANDTLDDMVNFIRARHPTSAGIVYTRTRKEADTVAQELQGRGILAAAYYSDVSSGRKNQIHHAWMKNQTQVVVATIAFGLGINKPDVRFVIHHSMSKNLEAYYQESGRAGRDGNPADCILYYSPKDVPKMLSMVHGEQSSPLTWTMIKYGQQFGNDAVCRSILLQNLGEPNGDMEAALHSFVAATPARDVLKHSQTALQLLYAMQDQQVTMPMLVKEWRRSKNSIHECVQENPPSKDLTIFECEYIIVALLVQGLIESDCQYTAYDLVVYLRCTQKAEQFLTSPNASFTIRLPPPETDTVSPRQEANGGEWLSARKPAVKRKRSTTTTKSKPATKKQKIDATSTKAKTAVKKTKTPASTRKSTTGKTSESKQSAVATAKKNIKEPPEVIDIDSVVDLTAPDLSRTRRISRGYQQSEEDDLMDDTDEEYEFDG